MLYSLQGKRAGVEQAEIDGDDLWFSGVLNLCQTTQDKKTHKKMGDLEINQDQTGRLEKKKKKDARRMVERIGEARRGEVEG